MTREWPPEPRQAGRLAGELRRLQAMGLGVLLRGVVWIPGERADVEAEVVEAQIRVYVADPRSAIWALRHEVIHFEVAQCCTPYVQALNRLLAAVNDEAYRRQEQLAEAITALLDGISGQPKPTRPSVRVRG